MDKTALLNTIQTEYSHFETLIAPLSETQLCTATLAGQWSIKDILAHIAVWEQLCARWLEEFLSGQTPQPSERLDDNSNDRIYLANHDRSLQEVQELFHHAHQHFLHQVNLLAQSLTEEDLNAPIALPGQKPGRVTHSSQSSPTIPTSTITTMLNKFVTGSTLPSCRNTPSLFMNE